MICHSARSAAKARSTPGPFTCPGVAVDEGRLLRLDVARELTGAFEEHAHLLAPARIHHRDDPSPHNPHAVTYWIDAPNAPAQAAMMTPAFRRSADGHISLYYIDWYDGKGALLREPTRT